jgi:hypothetical protein
MYCYIFAKTEKRLYLVILFHGFHCLYVVIVEYSHLCVNVIYEFWEQKKV